MHYYRFISMAFATSIVATALAGQDVTINSFADAYAFNPTHDHQEEIFSDTTWHGTSSITAVSEGHQFDPPINIATAMTQFSQPEYDDATLRSMSFVISDYSGIGATTGYKASTHFFLHQFLSVTATGIPGGHYQLQLLVPMHGFMGARSSASGTPLSKATVGLGVAVFGNSIADAFDGELEVSARDSDTFTSNATGGFANNYFETPIDLPTGDQPRSYPGIELNSSALLNLGMIDNDLHYDFEVFYDFTTSAEIESPNGSFALSDFSSTGHMTFQALDDSGNRAPNLSVTLTHAVPEPASLAALGLGIGALVRRRRK